MYDKELFALQLKYVKVIEWIKSLAFENLVYLGSDLKSIKQAAREHTIKTTGCTPEKFDKILKFIESSIFQPEDRYIAECYYDYLDNIRKTRE